MSSVSASLNMLECLNMNEDLQTSEVKYSYITKTITERYSNDDNFIRTEMTIPAKFMPVKRRKLRRQVDVPNRMVKHNITCITASDNYTAVVGRQLTIVTSQFTQPCH